MNVRPELAAADLPFWKRPIRLTAARGPTLRRQARATLIRQLATLAAVMPISDAVATLARQGGAAAATAVLARMHRALQAGSPLHAALPESAFPSEVRSTIAAGEASGRLPLLLARLADTLEAETALRSRLVATLAYPLLLLVVAFAVILAMLLLVVPGIAAQLVQSGQALPFLTRLVLGVSAFVGRWWWLLLLVPAAVALGLVLLLRHPERRLGFDRALLRLPGIGRALAALDAVRWARLLSTMLTAGLPLPEAMQITTPTLHNHGWRQASLAMTARIRAGSSLAATLPLLPSAPPLLLALAQSGESSGRLAPLLESAATSLDRQLSDQSRLLLALAEPVIIVVLGGLVGLIILAVLLPILQLNTLAGAGIGGF